MNFQKPFKDEVDIAMLKLFLGLDQYDCSEIGGDIQASVLWLERLNAWVAVLVHCFTEIKTWRQQLKAVYRHV